MPPTQNTATKNTVIVVAHEIAQRGVAGEALILRAEMDGFDAEQETVLDAKGLVRRSLKTGADAFFVLSASEARRRSSGKTMTSSTAVAPLSLSTSAATSSAASAFLAMATSRMTLSWTAF